MLPIRPVSRACRACLFAIILGIAVIVGQPSHVAAQITSMTAADAGAFIRSQRGARVVLLYATTCRYSHEMFPEVVALTRRYSPLGVRFLAFSIDESPDLLEEYLGSVGYSFERLHIQPWQSGELIAVHTGTPPSCCCHTVGSST